MNKRTISEKLERLLDEWDEARAKGSPLTPEEVCRRDPELLGPLIEKIEMLRSVQKFVGPIGTDSEPKPPTRIGSYSVVRELGRGGMGIVYLCNQVGLDRAVAVKIMPGLRSSDAGAVEFQREGKIAAQLQHSGIAHIYDAGEFELDGCRCPYLAMEFVDGTPLDEYAEKLAPKKRIAILASCCDAITHAHSRGVIHCDIKPSNIIVGERGQPKIVDFGVAAIFHEQAMALRSEKRVIGSVPFMSPEQLSGNACAVDERSDVFALGVTLFVLLGGKLPSDGSAPVRIESSSGSRSLSDPDLTCVVEAAITADPRDRYASVSDLSADLRRYLRGDPVSVRAVSRAEKLWRAAKQHPAVSGLLVLVIAALATGAGVSTHFAIKSSAALSEAIRERHRAEAATSLAEQSAAQARAATDVATRETERRRRQSFNSNLVRIQAIKEENPTEAQRLLADEEHCPAYLRNFTWRLLHRISHKERFCIARNSAAEAVAVSDGGGHFAVLDRGGTISVLSAENGDEIFHSRAKKGGSSFATFSSDGGQLLFSNREGRPIALDPSVEGAPVLFELRHKAQCGCYSPNGRLVATGGNEIHIWSPSGDHLLEIPTAGERVRAIRFNGGGTELCAITGKGTFSVWNAMSGRSIGTWRAGKEPVSKAAISKSLVATAVDGKRTISIWDVSSGSLRSTLRIHGQGVESLAFSPDGKRLAAGTHANIDIFDTEDFLRLVSLGSSCREVRGVAFSKNGETLLAGSTDKRVRLWDTTYQGLDTRIAKLPSAIQDICPIRGDAVATVSADGSLRVVSSKGDISSTITGKQGPAHRIALSPGKKRIAFQSKGASLAIVDTSLESESQREIKVSGETNRITSFDWSPDGKLLAAAIRYGAVYVLDANSGDVLHSVSPSDSYAKTVLYGPDGRLMTFSSRGTCDVWTGESLEQSLGAHEHVIVDGVFLTDGKKLATASRDNTARIWEWPSLQLIATLQGHTDNVLSISASPKCQTLATASRDGTVRLWDSTSGDVQASITVDEDPICVCFSADGKILFIGCRNGSLFAWGT